VIFGIKSLLNLKKNIYFDRSVVKLSFSGKNPRKRLIKYLDKHSLKTEKRIVYKKWKKASLIMESGLHFTKRGKGQIVKLKEGINK